MKLHYDDDFWRRQARDIVYFSFSSWKYASKAKKWIDETYRDGIAGKSQRLSEDGNGTTQWSIVGDEDSWQITLAQQLGCDHSLKHGKNSKNREIGEKTWNHRTWLRPNGSFFAGYKRFFVEYCHWKRGMIHNDEPKRRKFSWAN